MTSWLTLQDYSIKKGVSVSTLRRKIKNCEIEHRLENGRYLLKADLENPTPDGLKTEIKSLAEKELKKLKTDKEDLLSLVSLLEDDKKELEKHFINLRNNHKDLLGLVSFLESEKKEWLRQAEEQKPADISNQN